MTDGILWFSSRARVVIDDGRHKTIIVPVGDLVNNVSNSSLNRSPDPVRVDSIVSFIVAGVGSVNNVIHVAQLESKKFDVYDGIHRCTAWKKCIQIGKLSPDKEVIMNVFLYPTPQELAINFEFINKSVPVPASYIDTSNTVPIDDRNCIHDIVKDYAQKYPSFASDTTKCHRPNFNRDTFDDDLYDLYKSYILSHNLTINELKACLVTLNVRYSIANLKLPKTAVNKCGKYGFYLFVYPKLQRPDFEEELLKLRASNTI